MAATKRQHYYVYLYSMSMYLDMLRSAPPHIARIHMDNNFKLVVRK